MELGRGTTDIFIVPEATDFLKKHCSISANSYHCTLETKICKLKWLIQNITKRVNTNPPPPLFRDKMILYDIVVERRTKLWHGQKAWIIYHFKGPVLTTFKYQMSNLRGSHAKSNYNNSSQNVLRCWKVRHFFRK